MSVHSSLLRGTDGFQRIPEMQNLNPRSSHESASGDATVNIPLTGVQTTKSGYRQSLGPNEKSQDYEIRKGGRRRPHKDLRGSDIEEVNGMGRIYRKILRSSIILRYFLYIIPIGAILTVPIVVGAVVRNPGPPGIGNVRIVWIFAWALTVWVALWVSKLFTKALPYILGFFWGVVSPGTRKYATVIKALEIPISLFLWALASLATFKPVITNNPGPYTFDSSDPNFQNKMDQANNWIDIVTRVLAAFLACAGIYLAEKTLIQLISVNYHRNQYEMKIRESKENVHILSVLYEASTALFPQFCPEFLEEDYIISDAPELGSLNGGHGVSGTGTPMRILARVNRLGDRITAAFGNIAQEVTGKEVFNPTSAHSVVVEALEKTRPSEALAKRIWMSLVAEGKEALYQEDLIEVLVDQPANVAVEAFDALDTDKNGDVTLDEMILKVCDVGRSRKAVASSLHDVDQAINVLDNLLLTLVLLLCIFVFIAFLNTSFVTTLATAGTALLSLSFVFSATAQEVLGSCIFLFVKHPFDVGDVVVVNTQKLIVERISLLYTTFKAASSHTTTQCPNVVLGGLWIDNITRSKSMRESLLLDVSFDTTLEDVELLRREMEMFVRDEDNSRDFEPNIEVELRGVGSMTKLELGIDIKHKSNWSNGAVTAARRSKFMCALVLAVRKVPIYAPGGGGAALGSADQPSYSVSVTDEQAAEARAAFEKSKLTKHIKSYKPPPSRQFADLGTSTALAEPPMENTLTRQRSAPIGSPSEVQALGNLTSRAPYQDANHDWRTADKSSVVKRSSAQPLSPVGPARSREVENAYDLRRMSTHGKRRASQTSRESTASNMRPPPRSNEPLPGISSTTYQTYTSQSHPGTVRRPSSPGKAKADDSPTVGQYNPYIQTAPIYEYPPENGSEDGARSNRTGASARTPRPPGALNRSHTNLPHELDADRKSTLG